MWKQKRKVNERFACWSFKLDIKLERCHISIAIFPIVLRLEIRGSCPYYRCRHRSELVDNFDLD
ncbi:hypothetical protein H5410_009467 [Solanum commersonii]|uniref:Uncharacterized protein n=1 Tax=Solanum commersonii TaxID=4109 RepID=A0A9J6AII2_SOLCO|nr:hypothetical protein H5410_009467 [Solanum commersonii]